jgi:hypothetical protein
MNSKNIIANNLNVTYQDLFAATMKVLPEIPYDKLWENGTGYFDNLAKRKVEKVCKSSDRYGRSLMLIPTDIGTLVVFRRFTNSDQLCFHVPQLIRKEGAEDRISAGGETFVNDITQLSESAQERQMEVRIALINVAIQNLHNRRSSMAM